MSIMRLIAPFLLNAATLRVNGPSLTPFYLHHVLSVEFRSKTFFGALVKTHFILLVLEMKEALEKSKSRLSGVFDQRCACQTVCAFCTFAFHPSLDHQRLNGCLSVFNFLHCQSCSRKSSLHTASLVSSVAKQFQQPTNFSHHPQGTADLSAPPKFHCQYINRCDGAYRQYTREQKRLEGPMSSL